MDKISSFTVRNPETLVRSIGRRIKRQRLAKGWTQTELAERSGVSPSTLKLIEREGRGSLQRLAKVAVVLDLDAGLRDLFAVQQNYNSLEEVERTHRKRAPRRKNS